MKIFKRKSTHFVIYEMILKIIFPIKITCKLGVQKGVNVWTVGHNTGPCFPGYRAAAKA